MSDGKPRVVVVEHVPPHRLRQRDAAPARVPKPHPGRAVPTPPGTIVRGTPPVVRLHLYVAVMPGCPACRAAKGPLSRFTALHPEIRVEQYDVTNPAIGWPGSLSGHAPAATPTYDLVLPRAGDVAARRLERRVGGMQLRDLELWVSRYA